jgi:hypothetical protein
MAALSFYYNEYGLVPNTRLFQLIVNSAIYLLRNIIFISAVTGIKRAEKFMDARH